MRERIDAMAEYCALEVTTTLLASKWRPIILKYLLEGTHRFGELQRRLPGITHRVLTHQLRELEKHGLVARTDYDHTLHCVEYSVTDAGRSLRDVITTMEDWGRWYRSEVLPLVVAGSPSAAGGDSRGLPPTDERAQTSV